MLSAVSPEGERPSDDIAAKTLAALATVLQAAIWTFRAGEWLGGSVCGESAAKRLKSVAAGARNHAPSSEGRCIPRFQVYRMSAQTDCLLVWRLIRCDAPGLKARSNAGGSKRFWTFPRAQGAAAVYAFWSALR